jgi:hypothetical protein
MFSPPPMPAAPPPPVFAQAAEAKPQKKGPAQPTVVGSAPAPGQMGSATLLGQSG